MISNETGAPDEVTCQNLIDFIAKYNDAFEGKHARKYILITIYALISTIGVCGNALVIFAVSKRPELRTLRNYFIVNLAFSDFLMCTVTAPFTLFIIANVFWPFGDVPCRIVAASQGINIFVSTMSLAAIGLDRYLLIIFPVRFRSNKTVVVCCLLFVWIISLVLAFPYLFATTAVDAPGHPYDHPFFLNLSQNCGVPMPQVCVELKTTWEALAPLNRTVYSLLCFVIQYLVPLSILSVLYCQIGVRLYRRAKSGVARSANRDRRKDAQNRQRRTLILLSSLVATFATCWLPLNLYNTLSNYGLVRYSLTSTFAYCHLIGMTTACINPILYGALNENFKTVFLEMFADLWKHCLCRCFRKVENQHSLPSPTQQNDCHAKNTSYLTLNPLQENKTLSQHSHLLNDDQMDVTATFTTV